MNPEQIQQKIFYGYSQAATHLGALYTLYRSATPINPISSGNIITTTRMSKSLEWTYMKANKYGNAVWNACLDAQSANSPNSCRIGDYLVPNAIDAQTYYASAVSVASGGSGYAVGDYILLQGSPSFTEYVNLIVNSVNGMGAITSLSIILAGDCNVPLFSNPLNQYYTTGVGTDATFNVTWTAIGSGGIDDPNIYYVQSLQFDLPPQVVECNRTISIIRPAQSTGPGYKGYAGYTPNTSTQIMSGMPASVLKERRGEAAPQKLPTDTTQPMWQVLIPNLGNVTVRVGDIIQDDLGEDYVIGLNELTDLGWRISAQQVVNAG